MTNFMTLSQLNGLISQTLDIQFRKPVWIRSEISEMHTNFTGHCYMDLIEKDPKNDKVVAKQKATIWASQFKRIQSLFEAETGQSLQAGIEILALARISYHPLYGMSLNITDIDSSLTLGEMARRRLAIIKRLKSEGIIEMNKQLPMGILPQRIAVISSSSAAGYGDFEHQLHHNAAHYSFQTTLFPAAMQGSETELSVINQLNAIFDDIASYDCVAIIRGGGASSDLAAFDNYNLAFHIAQFPLPILTGIGHTRDATITDIVAHKSLKTPTAVAEFLIEQLDQRAFELDQLNSRLKTAIDSRLQLEKFRLQKIQLQLPAFVQQKISKEQQKLSSIHQYLQWQLKNKLLNEKNQLDKTKQILTQQFTLRLQKDRNQLKLWHSQLEAANPKRFLDQGQILLEINGKPAISASQAQKGDTITALLRDGKIKASVNQVELFDNLKENN